MGSGGSRSTSTELTEVSAWKDSYLWATNVEKRETETVIKD